jgi:cytochrome c peroxidase
MDGKKQRRIAWVAALAPILGAFFLGGHHPAGAQSGNVVANAKYTSVYDAFMEINRFRGALGEGESPDDFWGQLDTRLENQAGRNLIKRPEAMSEQAFNGFLSFMRTYGNDTGIGNCIACHTPPTFTDGKPHQFAAGKQPIVTPGLRDLHEKQSFLHDGSAQTLEDAIKIHLANGQVARERKQELVDIELGEISLTEEEVKQVAEFIRSLKTVDKQQFREYLLKVVFQPMDLGF